MTVKDIFDTPAIREIEVEILNLQYEIETFYYRERNGVAIEHLLSVRKALLDKMFVLDDDNKVLLSQFNHCMAEQLKQMRQKMIAMLNAVGASLGEGEEIECVGKCFLGYVYPKEHPVQTMRAKKMWAMFNLWSHLNFSIYDLLWVRDFDTEIEIRKEYRNYNPENYDDDLDWKKADYYD